MDEAQAGFVRNTHRRCEDCDIREDLHSSGTAIPKRRHRIAGCQACAGKGEIPNQLKESLDPYRKPPLAGRAQFYEAKRRLRAHDERHRFRSHTKHFDICELLMQIPPGGFNHGRAKSDDGSWHPLESEGRDGDVIWVPSFKAEVHPLHHGTRYAYQKAKCRCFECRRWSATDRNRQRVATPMGRGRITSQQADGQGPFPITSSLGDPQAEAAA